jgi:hypothetical protein
MSNLQNLLEENLKDLDKNLYNTAKLQEIILFVSGINLDIIDTNNYEIYFNRKCLRDYKYSLLYEIIKKLESGLYNSKNNQFIKLKTYKILFLFQSKLESNSLEKFLKENVDIEQLLKNNDIYNSLKKQSSINKEIRNQKEVKLINKEKDILEKNIIGFIVDSVKELNDSSHVLIDDINAKKFNNNLKNIIDYFLKNDKIISKLEISDMDYLNLLIQQKSSKKIKSFDELDNSILIDLNIENNLLFLIKEYKFLEQSDFNSLMGNLLEIDEDGLLNVSYIKNIIQEDKENLAVYIFIHILKECNIPYNQMYINYLKNIYNSINQEKLYDDIVFKANSFNNLIDFPKYIFENALEKIKKNKKIVNISNDILNYYINNNISIDEFNNLNKDINVLNKIIKNKDNSYVILNQYINNILDKKINNLVNFGLVLNENQDITDLAKKLKKDQHYYDTDDEYIKKQLEHYKIKYDKSNNIYIHSPKILKNNLIIDIILKYYEWIDKSEKINKIFRLQKKRGQKNNNTSYKLDIDIKGDIDDIFQNILTNIFQHYLKSIQVYLDKEDNSNYRNLFYYFDEDKQIKVYTDNSIEELLIYVRNNLKSKINSDNKILKFLTDKIHYFLFNHKFYSIVHEEEIILFDIMKYDRVILVNLQNLFSQVNVQLQSNNLKQVNINKINKELQQIVKNEMDIKYHENTHSKKYNQIKEANDKENILSQKEMDFLGYYFQNEIFEFLKKTVKSGEGINFTKSGLQFIKILINILKDEAREKYSFNILKKNMNKSEYKKSNELQKHLNKLLKGEFKIIQSTDKYNPPIFISTSNIRNEMDDKATYQSNDVGFLELQGLKNLLKDKEQEKIEYNYMIINLVKLNFKSLNNIFKLDLQENDIKKVTDMFKNNNLKIKGIKGKLLYKIKLNNIYKKSVNSNSVIQDMVKELCILYFVDTLLINKNIKNISDIINLSIMSDDISQSLINKNVLVLNNKKIGKVLEKINNNSYKVKFGKTIKTLNILDFIIVDSLKNKIVKIIKGVYKSEYGIIKEYKTNKYLSKKEKKVKNKHIKYLKNILINNQKLVVKIDNANKNKVILDDEFKQIKKLRTKEINRLSFLKKKLTTSEETQNKQRLSYLKINKNVKKILSTKEKLLLQDERFERVRVLKYSANNLKTELSLLKTKPIKNYHIKIHIGEKRERDIFLSKNDIKLDISNIEREKILSNIIKQKKKINFQNLYEIVKYLFNNTNSYNTPEVDITRTEYYHTIYKNMIKILNEQKNIDISKLKSFEHLNTTLEKLNIFGEKIKKKLKKKKNNQLLERLSRNNNKIKIVQYKLSKNKKEFDDIKKSSKTLLKINENIMKTEKINAKKLLKKQEEKQKDDKLELSNKLIEKCSDIFDKFINTIDSNIRNCDILKELSEHIDYAIVDDNLDDIMADLEDAIDQIEEEKEEPSLQDVEETIDTRPIWEIEGRDPTWLELDDISESEYEESIQLDTEQSDDLPDSDNEFPDTDDESSIGGNPLLALRAASFLKTAIVPKLAKVSNLLKNNPTAVQMTKDVLQNPQLQQQALEMFQEEEIEEI